MSNSDTASVNLFAHDHPHEWVDVTTLFQQQCNEILSPQRPFLCDDTSFHLYDAMAASQLGHDKMDCCQVPSYHHNNTTATHERVFPRPAPTGLQDAFTPLLWDEWTQSEILGFALEVLVCVQALCAGASVGESTFTCLYAHAPVLQDMEARLFPVEQSLAEQLNLDENNNTTTTTTTTRLSFKGTPAQFIIYTLSTALNEITVLFRTIVQNADVYEEEDFVAQTYQIPFYSSDKDILQVLASAMDVLSELPQIQSPLGCILSFLVGFVSSISQLAKLSTDQLHQQVESIQTIVRKATEALDQLLLELHNRDTIPLAPPQAFDPYVYRPRVGNAPVRQVRTINTKDAIVSLRNITHELDTNVCTILLKANSLGRLRRMLQHVSRTDANILSRSLIVLNLYFENKILGQFEMTQWIWDDLQETNETASQLVHGFLQRLAKPIYDTLKLQTLNRNRQRAYMDVIMFPEWVLLQMEATALDAHVRSIDGTHAAVFTQYVLVVILRLMVQYISVGIELGLYCSHDDIGFAYWYLDFLLSGLLSNLSAIKESKETARIEKLNKPTSKGNQRNNKKKNNKQKNNGVEFVPKPQDLETDLELSVIALKRNLCRGSLRFLAALRQAGILTEKKYAFTSKERVFEERFRAFSAIRQPPPLVYEQYVQGSDFSSVLPEELQQSTAEWFQSCKRAIEHLQNTTFPSVDAEYAPIRESELKSLLKVCVGNSVYLHKLRQVLQDPSSASSVRVEFDTKTHDQYCTIKLS